MRDKTSDKTSDKRLLSCPFCGGEIEILPKGYGLLYGHCMNGCFVSSSENSKNYLIEKLNTRKPMQEIVERLEERKENCRKGWETMWSIGAYSEAIEIVKEVGGMND